MAILEFSGSPEELKDKIEEAVATYELLGPKEPADDFDKWFEQWENGFPAALDNRGLGNYQLTGEKAWRSDPSKRPRWRKWGSEKGIITGEYWRDRSVEEESIVLSDTGENLIKHVNQIEYEGGVGEKAARGNKKNLPPLPGQPEIFLHFQEDKPTITNYKIRAEKTFRIMNKTDDPYSELNKISNADLKTYANRILQNFYTGNSGVIWRKGKECVSYKGQKPRGQGIDGWHFCRTKQDGIELFDRIGAVAGVVIDRKFLRRTTVEDEEGAFPQTPQTATVLGKAVELPLRRPLCDVRFQRAEIYLPFSRQTIPLVLGGKEVVS